MALTPLSARPDRKTYREARQKLVEKNAATRFTKGRTLDADEQRVDAKLGSLKQALRDSEYDRISSGNGIPYWAAPFVTWRDGFLENPNAKALFEFLYAMPKGGVHHAHNAAMGPPEWYVRQTKRKDCQACVVAGEKPVIVGYQLGTAPVPGPPTSGGVWMTMEDVRKKWGDAVTDAAVLDSIRLPRRAVADPDIWSTFQAYFGRYAGLVNYREVAEDYYRDTFRAYLKENSCHIEIRMSFPTFKPFSPVVGATPPSDADLAWMLEMFKRILADPEFKDLSLRLIFCASRTTREKPEDIMPMMLAALRMRDPQDKLYSPLVAGFDLVGEEDTGRPTVDYVDECFDLLAKCPPHVTVPFFFHDGESDRPDDTNLYDAFLLDTRRVGHGYNLFKFPALVDAYRDAGICVEVCPVSNQVLGYVRDVRNHPGASYLARGLAVTLSPDDPTIFGYVGVTHDHWMATMAWDLDLLDLRTLAENIIEFSSLDEPGKERARGVFQQRWRAFIAAHKAG